MEPAPAHKGWLSWCRAGEPLQPVPAVSIRIRRRRGREDSQSAASPCSSGGRLPLTRTESPRLASSRCKPYGVAVTLLTPRRNTH